MTATQRTAKTVAGVGSSGTILGADTACDNTNGDFFYQDGHTLLILNNTDSSSHTVTIPYVRTVDGTALTSVVLTLAASEVRAVAAGIPDRGYYGQPAKITFTANSNLVKFKLLNF